MKTDTYTYKPVPNSYSTRVDPVYEGVRVHEFLVSAKNMPLEVPHGCNPREQNIESRVYRKVIESFKDKGDPSFHLKNKGITVLAQRVDLIDGALHVEMSQLEGNVDGHHTYEIVTKFSEENPDQRVAVKIIENLPPSMIPRVAEGLNTSVQVTSSTIADHSGLFDEVHAALKDQEYHDWIAWRDNQTNRSATSKTLVSLMWVCNPLLFLDEDTKKFPNWIYQRSAAVFENGFYDYKRTEPRRTMLKVAPLLPDIIELYKYINVRGKDYFPKRRKPVREDNSGKLEFSVIDLYEMKKSPAPFTEPVDDCAPDMVMRDAYTMIIISGLRALIQNTGEKLSWKLNKRERFQLIDASLPSILNTIKRQLKQDRGDHVKCTRTSSLWDVAVATMGQQLLMMKKVA